MVNVSLKAGPKNELKCGGWHKVNVSLALSVQE